MVSSTVWDQNFMSYDFLSRNWLAAAAAAKSTLCDPRDGSPPGSPVPGIFQARTLVWVAISFPNAWKWKVKVKSLSRVWLLVTPWTAAYQPTRLLHPWDFPGKSTGVGCHFLLQLLKPRLRNFEHYLASIWNVHDCAVVWAFLYTAHLWYQSEIDHFRSCGHWWVFQISWHIECRILTASSFRI